MLKFISKAPGLPAFLTLSIIMLAAIILALHGNMPPLGIPGDFWSQVLATVLGAVVAAGFSYALARYAILQAEKAQAFQLIIKVSLIANDLATTMRAIDSCLSEANEKRDTGLEMWQRVLPIVGNIPIETPAPTELAPLFAAKQDSLGNEIIEISMRYQAFRSALERYNQLRAEIRDLMPVHEVDAADRRRGTTKITKEEASRLQPRFVELENLIRAIVKDGRADLVQVGSAAEILGPTLRRVFKDDTFPVLKVPDLQA